MKSDSIFFKWEHFMIYIVECGVKGSRDDPVIESSIIQSKLTYIFIVYGVLFFQF